MIGEAIGTAVERSLGLDLCALIEEGLTCEAGFARVQGDGMVSSCRHVPVPHHPLRCFARTRRQRRDEAAPRLGGQQERKKGSNEDDF
jgi:hypothetical protein